MIMICLLVINPILTSVGMAAGFKPSIGDTGGLPGDEVAMSSLDGRLYLFNLDRSYVRHFPKNLRGYAVTSPTLIDVEQSRTDSFAEIVVFSQEQQNYYLNIFKNNGDQVASFGVNFEPTQSPIAFDFDQNGLMELVVGDQTGKLYVWDNFDPENLANPDMIQVSEQPIQTLFFDVDQDEVTELVTVDESGVLSLYTYQESGFQFKDQFDTGVTSTLMPYIYLEEQEPEKQVVQMVQVDQVNSTLLKYTWENTSWSLESNQWFTLGEGEDVVDLIGGDVSASPGQEIAFLTKQSQLYILDGNGQVLDGFPQRIEQGVYINGLGIGPAKYGDQYQSLLYTFDQNGIQELDVSDQVKMQNWGEENYHQSKPALSPKVAVTPDPFSPNADQTLDETLIQYGVATQKPVAIQVSVAKGDQLVEELKVSTAFLPKGYSNLPWQGAQLSSGVYNVNFDISSTSDGGFHQTKEVTVDIDQPELSISNMVVVSLDPETASSLVQPHNQEVIVSTTQGLQITYDLNDNYQAVPQVIMELTNVETEQKVKIHPFESVKVGRNTILWDGKSSENTYLEDGVYTFQLYARDLAGNRSPVITALDGLRRIRIDRSKPEIEITANPMLVIDGQPVTNIECTLTKEVTLPVTIQMTVTADDGQEIRSVYQGELADFDLQRYPVDTLALEDGMYKVVMKARDGANNGVRISSAFVKNNLVTKITDPVAGSRVSDQVMIKGVAVDPDWLNRQPFDHYELYYHPGQVNPQEQNGVLDVSNWSSIPVPLVQQDSNDPAYPTSNRGGQPVNVKDILGYWDLNQVEIVADTYTLLVISYEKKTGKYFYDTQEVTVQTDQVTVTPELSVGISEDHLLITDEE